MTANEMGAVAMMEKLTRIWVPETTPRTRIWAGVSRNLWFKFEADIDDNTRFRYDEGLRDWLLFSTEACPPYDLPDDQYCGYEGWICFDSDWALRTGDMCNISCIDSRTQFTRKWLPYFRRSCWLSGCQVEASAAEKAEWVRGFTREEIDVWDLSL